MTDLFDRAQKQEQENRDRDLANQLARRRIESKTRTLPATASA